MIPASIPEGTPWRDVPNLKDSKGNRLIGSTPMNAVQIDCPKCIACAVCKGFTPAYCTITVKPVFSIDVTAARNQPPPNPAPSGYQEPDWTYGHEQAHLQNMIDKAKELMRSMDEHVFRSKCYTDQSACEIRSLEILSNALLDYTSWVKDEVAHLHPPFNVPGGVDLGIKPIGKVPTPIP